MSKCKVSKDGRHVTACRTLERATQFDPPPKGKSRGVARWALTNLNTGKPSRTFYGVKSGEFCEKGMAFNFCPFCGTNIEAPLNTTALTTQAGETKPQQPKE